MATLEKWKKAGLFVPYYGKEWDAKADQDALRKVQEWIDNLDTHIWKDGLGLLLMGEPGRGKTLLAHLAADAVLDYGEKLPQIRGRDVLLALTTQSLLDMFHRSMECMDLVRKVADEEAAEEHKQIDRTINALHGQIKVVLIDDIGKEYATATGYVQNQIEHMIRARGNRGLPTIITTNLDADGLRQRYGESFLSYMLQVCIPVAVEGADHRRRSGSLR